MPSAYIRRAAYIFVAEETMGIRVGNRMSKNDTSHAIHPPIILHPSTTLSCKLVDSIIKFNALIITQNVL